MTTKDGVIITNPRRIPVEGIFIHYDSNDILYAMMYALATYNPTEKNLYLLKKTFTQHKKSVYNICGFTDARMMKRHLTKLIEKGLVSEDETNYYFPQNTEEKYRIIEKDMLQYLANTRSNQAIRVYISLLDWFLWKKKENTEFIFTNKDILEKLGYSPDNKIASSTITDILESFGREGVIKVEHFHEIHILASGKEVPVPRMRLVFVARDKKEILTTLKN